MPGLREGSNPIFLDEVPFEVDVAQEGEHFYHGLEEGNHQGVGDVDQSLYRQSFSIIMTNFVCDSKSYYDKLCLVHTAPVTLSAKPLSTMHSNLRPLSSGTADLFFYGLAGIISGASRSVHSAFHQSSCCASSDTFPACTGKLSFFLKKSAFHSQMIVSILHVMLCTLPKKRMLTTRMCTTMSMEVEGWTYCKAKNELPQLSLCEDFFAPFLHEGRPSVLQNRLPCSRLLH